MSDNPRRNWFKDITLTVLSKLGGNDKPPPGSVAVDSGMPLPTFPIEMPTPGVGDIYAQAEQQRGRK